MPGDTHGRVTTPAAARPPRAGGQPLRQRLTVAALVAAVIAADQAAKWWAWRHVAGARINPGGDFLTGPAIGRWYAAPVTGAVLDLLDFALVTAAAVALARRPRRAAVTVCGSLLTGGWGSNLLDRLGMHCLTAPGSTRGAVDFIALGGHSWNPADFIIIGATPLFLLAAAFPARRAAARPPPRTPPPAAAGSLARLRAPAAALACAGLIMSVALGAAHQGGLIRPAHAIISSRRPGRARQQAAHPAPRRNSREPAGGAARRPSRPPRRSRRQPAPPALPARRERVSPAVACPWFPGRPRR